MDVVAVALDGGQLGRESVVIDLRAARDVGLQDVGLGAHPLVVQREGTEPEGGDDLPKMRDGRKIASHGLLYGHEVAQGLVAKLFVMFDTDGVDQGGRASEVVVTGQIEVGRGQDRDGVALRLEELDEDAD